MKKAFTLIELLITISIVCIFFAVIFGIFKTSQVDSSQPLNPFYFPHEANAQANQKLAEEIAEQNRLMRELLSKKQ